jgi:hypothetical protein
MKSSNFVKNKTYKELTIMKTFYSKALSVIAMTMLLAFNSVQAQVPNDSIVADFNDFIRLLEETHPDPYTNYGGRPFFRRAAMETRLGLVKDSVTSPDELASRITVFLAPMKDGHTDIWSNNFEWWRHAPIRFEAMNEGIIYVHVLPAQYKELLGSKLVGIENMSVEDILTAMAKRYHAENEIGRMELIGWDCVSLDKVIPNIPKDSITYHLETPEGKQVALTLPFTDERRAFSDIEECGIPETDIFPSKQLEFDFVGEGKNTMYMSIRSIMARDCIEYMRDNGWEYESSLKHMFYQLYRGQEMPSDPNEAIAMLPSFSGEFEKMLLQMKENGSKNLIIDLRHNNGGFTPITIPTLYQMWGDKFIKKSSTFNTEGCTIISPLYIEKYNTSLEQMNADSPVKYEYGDYQWEEQGESITQVTDEIRNKEISHMMSSVKDKLMAQKGKPVYTPEHVYVLTNPGTFSAAFHYAFFLWKMGATIVGITSRQAPNTFMEQTPFELPRTGLKGSISNSLQLFLPADDPRAKDFYPDLMPTYEDFKRYNFDWNTIPMYLMDIIEKQ